VPAGGRGQNHFGPILLGPHLEIIRRQSPDRRMAANSYYIDDMISGAGTKELMTKRQQNLFMVDFVRHQRAACGGLGERVILNDDRRLKPEVVVSGCFFCFLNEGRVSDYSDLRPPSHRAHGGPNSSDTTRTRGEREERRHARPRVPGLPAHCGPKWCRPIHQRDVQQQRGKGDRIMGPVIVTAAYCRGHVGGFFQRRPNIGKRKSGAKGSRRGRKKPPRTLRDPELLSSYDLDLGRPLFQRCWRPRQAYSSPWLLDLQGLRL